MTLSQTVRASHCLRGFALVFGLAVIWPNGSGGSTNWFAAVMSILAFAALYKLKLDVLWVVLAGGIIGLARTLLFN